MEISDERSSEFCNYAVDLKSMACRQIFACVIGGCDTRVEI